MGTIVVQAKIEERRSTEALQALGQHCFEKAVLRQALEFTGPAQENLFALAREQREKVFPGGEVEVRSVIEISNTCRQRCNFCNLGGIPKEKHYLMGLEEVLRICEFMYEKGRRVVMLQSGEWPSRKFVQHMQKCVEGIKGRFPDLELILCLGNLDRAQYQALRNSGADRYILKFETSNPTLYRALKPHDRLEQRLACLEMLVDLGFKVGSGNMVGFPGQTVDDVVEDLLLLGRYRLYMASCSVFIPGEQSKFAGQPIGNIEWALNQMALIRILYPDHLMPTTSALERARQDGQYLGLMAGANTVTIHDGTPPHLKDFFPIYSVQRFAPTNHHIEEITRRAGLRFAAGPLRAATPFILKQNYEYTDREERGVA